MVKDEPKSLKTNFIREWRLFRGFKSQGELATACEMTRPTVSRLESGVLPYNERQLNKLAKILQCSEGDLISTDPNLKGAIFEIYLRIPAKDRERARTLLESFATKPKKKPAKSKK